MAKGAGIGYLRGGARQTNGLVFWTTGKSGFGGYLDVKGKAGPSENNVYSMSTYKAEAIYGDEFLEIREGYGALNLGVCYETKPLLWLGGIGWGWSNKYREYYDRYEILGSYGIYYLDPEEENFLNLNIGLAVVQSPLFVVIVADSFLKQISFGVGFGSLNWDWYW